VRGAESSAPLANGLGRPPRIGICRTHHWQEAQPESVEAVESAAARFAELGAQIGDCELPDDFADLAGTHKTVLGGALVRSMADIRKNHGNEISEILRGMIDDGAATTPEALTDALAHADRCMMQFPTVTADWDVLLTPSAPGEAPEGMATGNPIFQVVWTLLQVPCLTLPWATGPKGLPVGVQLIGRKGDDERVLRVGKWFQDRQN
jgi:Asp-tRNA(Asn)/Glu-tRNA(Gln) amidotransferase A subunit family amidase